MSAERTRHLWSLPHPVRPARLARHEPTAGPGTPSGPSADDSRRTRLRELHESTYADLLRFVQRRLPAAEAEDVVASTFETAWVRLDDVPAEAAHARPWLFGVARNVMANHHRAELRRGALAVRLGTATTPDADVDAGGHDGVSARIDLVRAWRTLTDSDQEVLSLVAFDGLPGEQAARVLGISRSAFAMRLQRARQRLAAGLETSSPGVPRSADSGGSSRASRAAPTPTGGHHPPDTPPPTATTPLVERRSGDSTRGAHPLIGSHPRLETS